MRTSQAQSLGSGIPNLDFLLGGGIPVYSLNILAGPPGTGKTILAQQMMFHHVSVNPQAKALYLTTLSEPTLKVVRYMQHFDFFQNEVFGDRVVYQDIGRVVRERSLNDLVDHIVELVETQQPEILVIDSFKAIRDLGVDVSAFRRLCYDLSVRLASARCTTFLVGEYELDEIADGAEFAVADGIIYMTGVREMGEERRVIQVRKMRGCAMDLAPYPYVITRRGLKVLGPLMTLESKNGKSFEHQSGHEAIEKVDSGVPGLNGLLRGGIPPESTVLVAGITGTGKTIFSLQFLIHGARLGQKGLFFAFEETANQLHRMAHGFGWDIEGLEREGLLKIVYVSANEIRIEECMEQVAEEIKAFEPARVVVDSLSVLLHKVDDPAVQREKTFQMDTLIRRSHAVGLLVSEIPADEPNRLSRFGMETVVDGIFVFSTEMVDLRRKRYVEVFKMRGTDHARGRHRMDITNRGIDVYYSMATSVSYGEPSPALLFGPVQGLIGTNLPYGSAWLVRGEAGVGKSTLAYQFAVEGLHRKEAVLFIATDVPGSYVRKAMQALGFLPDPYIESGQLVTLDTFGGQETPLDLNDQEAFIFTIARHVERMPKPLRVVFDSLTPLALGYTPAEFVELVHEMNRHYGLHRPNTALFMTLLRQTLGGSEAYNLLNAFDVVLDLYTADVGELNPAGNTGYRVLRVQKTRGASADTRPYPYAIVPGEGIVVQKDYYQRLMGT